MAGASRARVSAAERACPAGTVRERAEARSEAPALILGEDGFDLIAEVKRTSPSAGRLATDALAPGEQAARYVAAGAAAISVLTEPARFSGELAHLAEVVDTVSPVPAMRKDFLVDTYQVLEARAAGAGGVLLIAAMLDDTELRDMLALTLDLGMFALVEAFDVADLERSVPIMLDAGPAVSDDRVRQLIGVNCRDLRSLDVSFGRFETLAGHLPADIPWVAESGVTMPADAAEVAGFGYRYALVGTALMRADDPTAAAAGLLEAGRAAAGDSDVRA